MHRDDSPLDPLENFAQELKTALGRANALFKAVHQLVSLVARFIMRSQPPFINESRLARC
jgi:hypothetical protein